MALWQSLAFYGDAEVFIGIGDEDIFDFRDYRLWRFGCLGSGGFIRLYANGWGVRMGDGYKARK